MAHCQCSLSNTFYLRFSPTLLIMTGITSCLSKKTHIHLKRDLTSCELQKTKETFISRASTRMDNDRERKANKHVLKALSTLNLRFNLLCQQNKLFRKRLLRILIKVLIVKKGHAYQKITQHEVTLHIYNYDTTTLCDEQVTTCT